MSPRDILCQSLHPDDADAILARLQAEGFFIGPIKATDAMVQAGMPGATNNPTRIWNAMVAEWEMSRP